jgi:hypothetical protein
MQDLSHLADNSMWPTSQEAGNMMSGRPAAMSAPGSDPVTPLPPAKDQGTPHVEYSAGPDLPPGTSGKPAAKAGSAVTGRPAWTRTTTPDVVRET